MAQDLNSVTLTGRVVADSTVKQFPNGGAILNFTVAVNKSVKGQDGKYLDKASFFDISYSSNGATNLSQYVKKGSQIGLSGELEQQVWEKEGKKNSRVLVKAYNVKLIGGNVQNQQQQQQYHQPQQIQGVSNGVPQNYQQPQQPQQQYQQYQQPQYQQQQFQQPMPDVNGGYPEDLPF